MSRRGAGPSSAREPRLISISVPVPVMAWVRSRRRFGQSSWDDWHSPRRLLLLWREAMIVARQGPCTSEVLSWCVPLRDRWSVQNHYVGDLGDFGKYGLLRALCSSKGLDDGLDLSLGVVWYLVPDEAHNDDGKFIRYLEPSKSTAGLYRSCDPNLYETLSQIVHGESRDVKRVREHQVLPPGTVFYDVPLAFEGIVGRGSALRERRAAHRSRWVQGALDVTAECDLTFADPDNGFEVAVKPHQPRGPKYAFFDELLPFVRRGQSLVVYHHIGRRGSAVDQVHTRLAQIETRLKPESDALALLYHRGSARAFFVIPADRHRGTLLRRIGRFLDGPWSRHFELVNTTAPLSA